MHIHILQKRDEVLQKTKAFVFVSVIEFLGTQGKRWIYSFAHFEIPFSSGNVDPEKLQQTMEGVHQQTLRRLLEN